MSTNHSDDSTIPQGPQADDALLGAHEKLLDRQPDEKAHYRLLPLVMLFVFSGLIFFAGTYLNRYSGHFAPTIFNENEKPHTGEVAAVKVDPVVVGKQLFNSSGACVTCHLTTGTGQPGIYPPLAGSEWVNGPSDRLIHIVLYGLSGTVHVENHSFGTAVMPTFGQVANSGYNWSDERIAYVLTYVRQDWGNKGGPITPEEVAAVREKEGSHAPETEGALMQMK
jgi:mono/diheme cytochrome c family protein